MEIRYLDADLIINLHDFIIEKSGGFSGIRDIGLLESALEHIQNDFYYPSFVEKLTHLVFTINKSHAFNDGNKRTSLSSGAAFLTINGWDEKTIKLFIIKMEDIVVSIANNELSKEDFSSLVKLVLSKYSLLQKYRSQFIQEFITMQEILNAHLAALEELQTTQAELRAMFPEMDSNAKEFEKMRLESKNIDKLILFVLSILQDEDCP